MSWSLHRFPGRESGERIHLCMDIYPTKKKQLAMEKWSKTKWIILNHLGEETWYLFRKVSFLGMIKSKMYDVILVVRIEGSPLKGIFLAFLPGILNRWVFKSWFFECLGNYAKGSHVSLCLFYSEVGRFIRIFDLQYNKQIITWYHTPPSCCNFNGRFNEWILPVGRSSNDLREQGRKLEY